MKRLIFAKIPKLCHLLLCFTLLLTLAGCSEASPLDENPDAQNEETPPSDETTPVSTPSMLMVDNILYIFSGEESTLIGRCGVMDGEITSTVAVGETPTENNQSNFGTGYGYQSTGYGTIEVYIDDAWVIFRENRKTYAYDDSENGISLRIEYPESWQVTEQLGTDGDETKEGSPSSGILFTIPHYEGISFSVVAMRFFPFELDTALFEAQPFETNSGLTATKYTRTLDGRRYVYYLFGDADTLPHYVAAVTAPDGDYEALQAEIDNIMKTLEIPA